MNLTKFNINTLAMFAFLLIFPLDYIAYTLGHIGFPSIPIGFLGTTISFALFFIFFLKKDLRISDLNILVFLGSFSFFIALSQNAVRMDYLYWAKSIGMFFVGIMMYDYFKQKNSIFYKHISILLLIIMSIFTLRYTPDGNYLRLSDAFVITSLFLVSYQKRFLVTILTVAISCFALYEIGSRAGVLIYSLIAILLIYAKYGFWKFSIFVPPALYVLYQFIMNLNESITNYNDNRLFRLLFSSDTDTSLNLRKTFNELGYQEFLNHPVLGNFGYYRNIYGEGSYAHNYISYLAEFGIIGIAFLILVVGLYVVFVIQNFKIRTNYNLFIFALSTFCIIGLASAKSYYWIVPFLALGLLYRAVSTRKYWKNHEQSS
ncbi:O-antigen ligase like membrane family protein [Acinetobacter baumannii 1035119]|uniref:O-antigen ligase family protein n=1 Tax=Acinetobacter baumannii TaxID=470 RepID=UPI000445DAE7|nr:O-antigen ligase [Acinetobacter baumannii]EXA60631.1 O-antigen ligase like membrane family protein [Acinetobacter baumannii 1035119]